MTAGKRAPGVPRSLRQICSKAGRSKSISSARRTGTVDGDPSRAERGFEYDLGKDATGKKERAAVGERQPCKRVPARASGRKGGGWHPSGKFQVERWFLASKKLICSGGT